MKKCSTCKQYKSLDHFHKCLSKYDGLQTTCIDCHLCRSRLPEGKLRSRKSKLKTLYGISINEYQIMFNKQQGLCLICNENKPLQVDHCHETNRIRGLLCHDCNVVLGFMKDSPALLRKAAYYLEGELVK